MLDLLADNALYLYQAAVLILLLAIGWMDWKFRKVNNFAVAALLCAVVMQYVVGKAGGHLIVTETDIFLNLILAMLIAAPGYATGLLNANSAKVLLAIAPLCTAPVFASVVATGAVVFSIGLLAAEWLLKSGLLNKASTDAGAVVPAQSLLTDLRYRGVPAATVLACGAVSTLIL